MSSSAGIEFYESSGPANNTARGALGQHTTTGRRIQAQPANPSTGAQGRAGLSGLDFSTADVI